MDKQFQHNAISKRLIQLAKKWKAFEDDSSAPLGIWEVKYDESRMVDAFVLMEDTDEKIVPSVFLTFQSDFTDPEAYAFELIKEFLMNIFHPTSKASLEEAGVDLRSLKSEEIKDTKAWLKLLADFADAIPFLKGHFVAYLLPKSKSDAQEWVRWIERLLHLDLPKQLRFMAKEEDQFPLLKPLIEDYPGKIVVLHPELDMGKALHEIIDESSTSIADQPGVKFQKLMIDVGQHVGEHKMGQAETQAQKALEIAAGEKWYNLEVAVYITLAGGYMGTKEFELARSKFQAAKEKARIYTKEEAELGKQLEVQALLGEAGTYLGEQNFEGGAPIYAFAAPIAASIEKYNLEMEAWRMTGFCYDYVKDYQSAWDYYQKALKAGEKMEEAMRRSSTFPYVGEALLALHPKIKSDIKKNKLEDELNRILGENWHQLTESAKT